MKTLTDFANEFGTDKGTLTGNRHGYTNIYDQLFAPLRHNPVRMLEVGLSIGGPEQGFSASRKVLNVPSINMWLSYFPKGLITGLDISDCSAFQVDRFDFIQADCGDQEALQRAAKGRQFDIVIDDGSHASFHQQLTMLELFQTVEPGGYYIIEDLDWQPEVYERQLPPVAKTTDFLTWLGSPSTHKSYGLFNYSIWDGVVSQIESVKLYRKRDIEGLVEPPRHGFFKRRRIAERAKILGDYDNPVKLAVIKKR